MLLKLNKYIVEDVIKDDPVRPHITSDWRTDHGREVFGLYEDESYEKLRSVICVAYTDIIPKDEPDMETPGTTHAVFYTVWSYDKGAGRDIVFAVADKIRSEKSNVTRYVTLSPLTDMASKFHINNGAKFLEKYQNCQNFEYAV